MSDDEREPDEDDDFDDDYVPEAMDDEDDYCHHCGAKYDGGHRCGQCGNGDPLDTGEFDPITGEQW